MGSDETGQDGAAVRAEGMVALLVAANQRGDGFDGAEALQEPLVGAGEMGAVPGEEGVAKAWCRLPAPELESGEVADPRVAAHVFQVADPESLVADEPVPGLVVEMADGAVHAGAGQLAGDAEQSAALYGGEQVGPVSSLHPGFEAPGEFGADRPASRS